MGTPHRPHPEVILAQVEGGAIPSPLHAAMSVAGFKPLDVSAPPTTDTEKLGYDAVHLPKHYRHFAIEPIRFIMENKLEPAEANVVKYVCRWRMKNGVEDLKKARRYLDILIAREEGKAEWWL